jgi:DNA-binding transcriptional ArsR family regulator
MLRTAGPSANRSGVAGQGPNGKRKKPLDSYIANKQYSYMAMHEPTQHLDLAFSALSDPTRRAILARLMRGEATVSELMAPFALSQPTISKHLKVLEAAGLIEGGRDAQRRPRRLSPLALKTVADWIDPFRAAWETRLDNLDAHLKKNQEK